MKENNEMKTEHGIERLELSALRIKAAAAAIANARIMRRGSPPMSNVLEILPPKLLSEVMEDAEAAITAAKGAA